MMSKTNLVFGFRQFTNYYIKIYLFNTFKCFGLLFPCFKCCKYSKHSSMTARKYKRLKNAEKKMSEELDIVQIVKTMRQVRLLLTSQLTPKQRQLASYLKRYSLETPTIYQEEMKKFSRQELIQSLMKRNNSPGVQRMNDFLADQILIGHKPQQVTYMNNMT